MVIEVGAQYPNFMLGPGAEQSFDFRAYYGPKVISFLKDFEPGAARVMHLAWGPLDYLARLLLWVLVALHGLIGSYGVAIILLTLMVRALFYPVTAKANASMRKMQQLQPKIKAAARAVQGQSAAAVYENAGAAARRGRQSARRLSADPAPDSGVLRAVRDAGRRG